MNITYTNSISVQDYSMLRDSAGWPQICMEQAQAGLKGSAFLIAAKHDENIVGMARIISDGGYFVMIVDVVVLPEYQGRGIGREMITQIIRFIKDKMKPDDKHYILLSSAPGKEFFYEKMGFHCIPDDHNGSGMMMRLRL